MQELRKRENWSTLQPKAENIEYRKFLLQTELYTISSIANIMPIVR